MRKMEANGVAQLVRMVVTTTDLGPATADDSSESASGE
jgi:hypothetical protein